MPVRAHYPYPGCPVCGETASKVVTTHYTKEEEILRNRKCTKCSHSWWSYQEIEINLDPANFKVVRPSKVARDSKKAILERLT